MTAQQIANRVKEQADARLPEVIERLFFLLDKTSDLGKLIAKWKPCGLLANVDEEDMGEAARALELTAFILIEECTRKGDTSWETNEDYICRRFKETVAPYEATPIGYHQEFPRELSVTHDSR